MSKDRNDKEEQKQLRVLWYTEMLREWSGNITMAEHCTKKAARIIQLADGRLLCIERPNIKTRFCFGYSDSPYDTKDYDDAQRMAHHAATNEDYFIKENLAEMHEMLERLNDICAGGTTWSVYIGIQYSGAPEDTRIYYWNFQHWAHDLPRGAEAVGIEVARAIRDALEIEIEVFTKRLRTYLKRYGLSKVEAWAYWRDE